MEYDAVREQLTQRQFAGLVSVRSIRWADESYDDVMVIVGGATAAWAISVVLADAAVRSTAEARRRSFMLISWWRLAWVPTGSSCYRHAAC